MNAGGFACTCVAVYIYTAYYLLLNFYFVPGMTFSLVFVAVFLCVVFSRDSRHQWTSKTWEEEIILISVKLLRISISAFEDSATYYHCFGKI
jgi:ABC-type Fe3+-siderophore transport system permease subunit